MLEEPDTDVSVVKEVSSLISRGFRQGCVTRFFQKLSLTGEEALRPNGHCTGVEARYRFGLG